MHNQWEEMLPFYVAGTLAKPEATRLEYHLSHCAACSQSLNDWRLVADAIRAEAASHLRDLPPLSPAVLHAAAERFQSRRFETAALPVRRMQPTRRLSSAPVALAAAAFTVLLVGGLVALMALRGTPQQQGANGVVLLPTETPSEDAATQTLPLITVIEPSITPTEPMQDVPSQMSPTFVQPTSIAPPTVIVPTRIPPTFVPPTSIAPPTAALPEPTLSAEMALVQIGVGGGTAGCTLQAAIPSGSVINLYAQPRIDSAVLTTISAAEELVGLATSDNSWYRLQSERGNVGWVQQGLVLASGNCDGLPLIPVTSAAGATPTETVLPFPSLEPVEDGETQEQSAAATESVMPVES